ncbi:hypothetical protein SprV_0401437600 [Sparganum proliferum]
MGVLPCIHNRRTESKREQKQWKWPQCIEIGTRKKWPKVSNFYLASPCRNAKYTEIRQRTAVIKHLLKRHIRC